MFQHWADKIADEIIEERGDKSRYVFNCGMSISGMMHIGNLRGELVLNNTVQKVLNEEGKNTDFKGIYYTQDRFKGKESQLNEFDDPQEAEKYVGMRLIDVPDPFGCHENWVEHYNSESHPYLKEFGIDVDAITTTEFYKMEGTKKLIKRFLRNKDRVRKVVNRFRDRNPYSEDWIPYDALCEECSRIDKTKTLDFDLDEEEVKYYCEECGSEGWSSMEEGKLAWRLEWAALWHVLDVDFEPYGKDHATPGGSRDSCVALCEEFDLNYPAGFGFNWVYLKDDGDIVGEMTSSGKVGLTIKDFLNFSEPEVLNYLYISTKPMKEIYFDPKELPTYYRRFDRAEEIYFGERDARSEKREKNIKRDYELSVIEVADEKPVRPSFEACIYVVQLSNDNDKALQMLRKMDELPENVSSDARETALNRLERARNWINVYGSEDYLIDIMDEVSEEVFESLSDEQIEVLKSLRDVVSTENLEASELQQKIYELKDDHDISAGDVFGAIYLVLLGKDSGPRAGQLIKAVGEEKVLDLLNEF